MKRKIAYLVGMVAMASVLAMNVPATGAPIALVDEAPISVATEGASTAATPCIECDYAFGACMSECWATGSGPPCKNDCLAERAACRATCE
jgi:hypothetical protein